MTGCSRGESDQADNRACVMFVRWPDRFNVFPLHRSVRAAQRRTAASSAQTHPEPRRVAGAHHAILQYEAAVGHVAGEVEAPVEVEVAGRR